MQKIKITFAIILIHFIAISVHANVIVDVVCTSPTQMNGLSHQLTTLMKSNVGEIIVSVRGGCVRIFSQHEDAYADEMSKLELLSELGVLFIVDKNSLAKSKTEPADVEKFVYVQDDLLAELVKLQKIDKYSYIHYASNAYEQADNTTYVKKEKKESNEKKLKFTW